LIVEKNEEYQMEHDLNYEDEASDDGLGAQREKLDSTLKLISEKVNSIYELAKELGEA
jgi:hypothetical protein